jgi:hypothetical protein
MNEHFNGPSLNPQGLEHFALLPDRAEFRPLGKVSLSQAADLVTAGVKHARAHKQKKLLVDISQLTGFEPPSVPQRYFIVRGWTEAARGHVRLAVVARQETIDPQRFGVVVASNAGMTANIFAAEAEALAWLLNGA